MSAILVATMKTTNFEVCVARKARNKYFIHLSARKMSRVRLNFRALRARSSQPC